MLFSEPPIYYLPYFLSYSWRKLDSLKPCPTANLLKLSIIRIINLEKITFESIINLQRSKGSQKITDF